MKFLRLNKLKLNDAGFDHVFLAVCMVVVFAIAGTYYLVSSNADTATTTYVGPGGKCLDNRGDKTRINNEVDLYTCNGTKAQEWSYLSNGELKNVNGYCLTPTAPIDRAYVVIRPCDNATVASGMLWTFNSTSDTFKNKANGLCLDDQWRLTTNFNPIWIFRCNGTPAQHWQPGIATPPPPNSNPTVSLSVSPSSITVGQSATLTWSSTNSTTCTASGGWNGSEPTSGKASTGTISTASTVQYDLSCTNAQGPSATSQATLTVVKTPPPPQTGSICGSRSGTSTISKVMIIWEENESESNVIGNSQVPYMNQLANECGYAANYWSLSHPSLPNYMASTSGEVYPPASWDDCSPSGCTTANPSIFSQLGNNWEGYAESMPSNCDVNNAGTNDAKGNPIYAVRHNPPVYYTNITSVCKTNDVPLGTSTSGALLTDVKNGNLKAFSSVTPNLMDDWHDGTAAEADGWLKTWIPIITSGPDYQNGKLAVLILFDEAGRGGAALTASSQTAAIWLSPYTTAGSAPTTRFDNISVARTVDDVLGLSPVGQASSATSMVSSFNL